jgi:hypothetical protein
MRLSLFVGPNEARRWVLDTLNEIAGERIRRGPGVALELAAPVETVDYDPRWGDARLAIEVTAHDEVVLMPNKATRHDLGVLLRFLFEGVTDFTYLWVTFPDEVAATEAIIALKHVMRGLNDRYRKSRPDIDADLPAAFRQFYTAWQSQQLPAPAASAAVLATPDPAAGVGEKPKGQRRRGRLPLADAEKRAVCERWLKAQVTTRQYDFCNGEGIAASTLREWLNDLGIE